VLVPPTLTILLVEIFGLSLISLKIHANNAFRVTAAYSVFGVFIEATVGGLVGAGWLIALIFAPYVWISYSFISLLPISVLIADRQLSAKNPEISAVSQNAEYAHEGLLPSVFVLRRSTVYFCYLAVLTIRIAHIFFIFMIILFLLTL